MGLFGPGLMSPAPAGPGETLLPALQELATPAARAVGALRGPSGEGAERLLAPEIGPPFLPCHFDHRQKCQSKHRQRDMPIPALPMAYFVFIQSDLPFGQLKGFFHLPAASAARTTCSKLTDSGAKTK